MTGLLERDAQLSALHEALRAGAGGQGRIVVLESPAGLGKTRLLEAAGDHARELGLRTLRARASVLDRSFAFGVVHQLLDPAVARAARAVRETPGRLDGPAAVAADALWGGDEAHDLHAVLHGLYWLLGGVATKRPVAILVDDAHWCDEPSLRWLEFVARRIDGLPVALVLATRPAVEARDELLIALTQDPQATVLRPGPLSAGAVAALVHERLGAAPEPGFAEACRTATGGNPFLLELLLRGLAEHGVQPVAADAPRIDGVGPAAVAPAVLRRLADVEDARPLAHGLAVLAPGSPLDLAAAVAGLELAEARRAVDRLRLAGILAPGNPPGFVHGLVREAVEGEIGEEERARLSRRAADLLRAAGASAERVGVHLLRSAPAGDAEVVEALREAARRHRASGAPDQAVVHLRRALDEPPEAAVRSALLLELGLAEARAGLPEAVERLEEAAALASDAERGPINRELALALTGVGRFDDAVALLSHAAAETPDLALARRLEAQRMFIGLFIVRDPGEVAQAARARAAGPGIAPEDRLVNACVALDTSITGGSAAEMTRWARAALAGGALAAEVGPDSIFLHAALAALIWSDELDEAAAGFREALAVARRRGSVPGLALSFYGLSEVRLRGGALREAEADARTALGEVGEGLPVPLALAEAVLVETLAAQGRVAETTESLERWAWLDDVAAPGLTALPFLHARGVAHAAAGRPREALASYLACARTSPGLERTASRSSWRAEAARLHVAFGDLDAARALLEVERELAESLGTPRALAVVERLEALLEPGRRVDLLESAAERLVDSPARLDRAAVLLDLGEALHARGDAEAARSPLADALAIADACAAAPLAERARAALVAAGARPRRRAVSGADALTPSERRVASLAASGASNREIAETLFVTANTVEKHLTAAYRKLGITTRAALAPALGEPERERDAAPSAH